MHAYIPTHKDVRTKEIDHRPVNCTSWMCFNFHYLNQYLNYFEEKMWSLSNGMRPTLCIKCKIMHTCDVCYSSIRLLNIYLLTVFIKYNLSLFESSWFWFCKLYHAHWYSVFVYRKKSMLLMFAWNICLCLVYVCEAWHANIFTPQYVWALSMVLCMCKYIYH